MNIIRLERQSLQQLLKSFPAVAVLGPRQIGKSTFVRNELQDFEYFDLENPVDLNRIRQDAELAFHDSNKIIIDEAQRHPSLFSFLRYYLDHHPKKKIVLLGSASPSLLKSITEALTGRIGFLELSGISLFEHPQEDSLWVSGRFPRIHWSKPKSKPRLWYPSYLKSYFEQDIPQLGFRISSQKLRDLASLLAGQHGGLVNLSEFGAPIGMDYHSVDHAMDILEGTFLIRRLRPYFGNLKKRLVKSPKIYFRDTGILHHLLGVEYSKKALFRTPKAGSSYEGFCIEQIISHAKRRDPGSEAYFFRTQTRVEVDLLIKLKGKWIPIEIKLNKQPQSVRSMEICMEDLKIKSKGYQVGYQADRMTLTKTIDFVSLKQMLEIIDEA